MSKPASTANINNAAPYADADEDALLVKKAQNGSTEAFEALVRKYEGKVFGITSRMLAFGEDSKDAAQEAFIKAYRSLKGFRGESKFSTWLYRITNNVCLDYLRKRNRRELPLDLGMDDSDGETRAVDIPADVDVESAVEDSEFRSLVQKAINSLPAHHRIMIIMRDIQDLSYTEIAQLIGVPEGTVKSKINRARKILRDALINFKELKGYINVK